MTSTSLSILPKPCWPLRVWGILQGSQPINPIEPQFVSNVLYVAAGRRLCLLLHLVNVLLLQKGGDCPGMITHGVIVSITNVDGRSYMTMRYCSQWKLFLQNFTENGKFHWNHNTLNHPIFCEKCTRDILSHWYIMDTKFKMWGVAIFFRKCT